MHFAAAAQFAAAVLFAAAVHFAFAVHFAAAVHSAAAVPFAAAVQFADSAPLSVLPRFGLVPSVRVCTVSFCSVRVPTARWYLGGRRSSIAAVLTAAVPLAFPFVFLGLSFCVGPTRSSAFPFVFLLPFVLRWLGAFLCLSFCRPADFTFCRPAVFTFCRPAVFAHCPVMSVRWWVCRCAASRARRARSPRSLRVCCVRVSASRRPRNAGRPR